MSTFTMLMPNTTTNRRTKDTDKNANECTRKMTNIHTENDTTTTTTTIIQLGRGSEESNEHR